MKFKPILRCLFLVFILILSALALSQNRDPNKTFKVAILPFMIHSQENLDYLRDGINDILTSRITVEGRIVVIERALVEQALDELKPTRLDEPTVMKIGKRIGADFIVLGSMTKIRDYISLDARLISMGEEKPPVTFYAQQKGIDNVMVKISEFAQNVGLKILEDRPTVRPRDEPAGPLITHVFTVEKVEYGDILKVYIEAEDTTGDMVRIATMVDQAGYGRYPTSWVKLEPKDSKHFKGYLQWNTFSSKTSTISEGTPITLTVTVLDKSGNSTASTFPITFESGGKPASSYQLPSPFDQKDVKKLGNIDVQLMDFTVWPQ